MRDSTGALPLEEIATSSGERSTIEGKQTSTAPVIHHVDQPVARVSCRKYPLVKRLILGGRNHQKDIIHQRVAEFRRPPAECRRAARSASAGDSVSATTCTCAWARSRNDLTFSNLAAADHQHGPLFQFGKGASNPRCNNSLTFSDTATIGCALEQMKLRNGMSCDTKE